MMQPRNEKAYACIGLALLIVLALAAVIGTSCHIRSYAKEPTAITGILEDVKSSPNCSIELCVGGNGYRLYKDNRYSKRSFGVLNNVALGVLENALYDQIGKEVYLEYVQLEANPIIVQLSRDGKNFVTKEVAVQDFIGYETTARRIWGSVFGIAAILLLLIWKGIIH